MLFIYIYILILLFDRRFGGPVPNNIPLMRQQWRHVSGSTQSHPMSCCQFCARWTRERLGIASAVTCCPALTQPSPALCLDVATSPFPTQSNLFNMFKQKKQMRMHMFTINICKITGNQFNISIKLFCSSWDSQCRVA